MITVRDMLKRKPAEVWTVTHDMTVYEALELMAQKNVGAVPVVEEGRLVGMFSERDYARKGILVGRSSRATLVAELMSCPVVTIGPSLNVQECLRLMTERQIRHLPVMENEQMVGLVSIGDIGKALISEQEVVIHDLEGYITGNAYCR
jgi:CBS domain-containing protein